MKKRKRLLSLFLSAVMLFSATALLTGCGSQKQETAGDKTHVVLNEVAHSMK